MAHASGIRVTILALWLYEVSVPVNDNLKPHLQKIASLDDVKEVLPRLREIALHSNQNLVAYLLAMAMAEMEASLPNIEDAPEERPHVREIRS